MPRLKAGLAMLGMVVLTAATARAQIVPDARHGAKLIAKTGCGACHSIPGIDNARGQVGPPLDNIGDRTIIAGLLPNTPENMMRWIAAPQSIVPGNAMPNMGLSAQDAADIAAYLETLKQE